MCAILFVDHHLYHPNQTQSNIILDEQVQVSFHLHHKHLLADFLLLYQ